LLNRTCFFLCKKISKAIKEINKTNNVLAVKHTELAAFLLKIVYLQKTLNQTNCHALQKINCLAAELNSNNDEIENETDSLL